MLAWAGVWGKDPWFLSLLRCLDRLESVLFFSALLHHPRGIEGLGLDGERSQGQPRGEVDAKGDIHVFLVVGFK